METPSVIDTPLLERAWRFAATAHDGQLRKGHRGDPYIVHPLEVMALLRDAGIDDGATLAAALLHDTVEDTPTPLNRIAAAFGEAVAGIVAETTDPPGLDRDDRRRHQVATLAAKSAACQNIKIGDKISNLRTILRDPPPQWRQADKIAYLLFSDQVIAACDKAAPALRTAYAGLRAAFLAAVPPEEP